MKKKVKGTPLSKNSGEDLLKFLKEKKGGDKTNETDSEGETIDNASLEKMKEVSRKISE